jgi:CRP-like cAMP-binding protein
LLRSHAKFFQDLTDGESGLILPCFSIKELSIGETVFSEGEEADSMAFIVSGRFLVTKKIGHRGRQVVLSNTGERSVLGEFSMISGTARTATAICIEGGWLLLMERNRLNEFIKEHPAVGCKILKSMILAGSQRQAKTAEKLPALA